VLHAFAIARITHKAILPPPAAASQQARFGLLGEPHASLFRQKQAVEKQTKKRQNKYTAREINTIPTATYVYMAIGMI